MNADNVLIKTEGLEKSFGKVQVLKGITTEIHKGEVVVIIGPSGSGKSTFLRTLNLLEEPNGNGFSAVQFIPAYDGFKKYDLSAYEAFKAFKSRRRKTRDGIA